MQKPFIALVLLLPLLAGCAELTAALRQPVPPPRPAPAVAARPAKAVPVPRAKPSATAPEQARLAPAQFIGRDAGTLVAQLGEPESVRDEPPATIWRYRVVGCRVDLFLYRNVETQELRALSYKLDGPAPACQAEPADAAAGQ